MKTRTWGYALSVLSLAVPSLGCLSPCGSTTGWHFEMGNPGTINAPAIVNHQSALYGASGLVAGPVAGGFASMSTVTRGPLPAADLNSCTLDDICRKLDDIARRLPTATPAMEPLAPPKPLPKGN